MKCMKFLAVALSIVFLYSCATDKQPAVVPEAGMEEPEKAVPEEPVKEKVLVEKEIVIRVPYVLKETSYYGDGQMDLITLYEYDDMNNLLERRVENDLGEVLETKLYNYNEGVFSRVITYGMDGQITSISVVTLDDEGNVTEEQLFNKKEELQSVNRYVYSEGKKQEWRAFDSLNTLLAITEYIWEGENLVKILIKDPGNNVEASIVKEYDSEGNMVKESTFDDKDKYEKGLELSYTDNQLTEVVYLNNKGAKDRSEVYEYDGETAPSKKSYLYKSGAVREYSLFEYKIEEVKKIILVEE